MHAEAEVLYELGVVEARDSAERLLRRCDGRYRSASVPFVVATRARGVGEAVRVDSVNLESPPAIDDPTIGDRVRCAAVRRLAAARTKAAGLVLH